MSAIGTSMIGSSHAIRSGTIDGPRRGFVHTSRSVGLVMPSSSMVQSQKSQQQQRLRRRVAFSMAESKGFRFGGARDGERREAVVTNASGGKFATRGGGFNIVPIPDRLVAALPYILPLLSALRYGRYFFSQFPASIVLLKPLMPILRLVSSVPLGNLILFFSIYIGIGKNQNLSRFCRFNAMQAILLDIALIFPSIVESILGPGILGIGMPGAFVMMIHNAIFLTVLAIFALSAVGCFTGRYVRIPIITEAAEAQLSN